MSITTRNAEILAKAVNLNKYKRFLKSLQTNMDPLDLAALMGSVGPWKDEDSDSVELLGFVLETLNKISDTSAAKDVLRKTALRDLEEARRWAVAAGEPLPGLAQDIDEHWMARKRSGNDSNIDETHMVQRIGFEIQRQPRRDGNDRRNHWHICSGCFNGFPCVFFGRPPTPPLLCQSCRKEDRSAGWTLRFNDRSEDNFNA
ncbi:hypothetical protein CLAIMM_01088 [Cladophialophora immunda]|nr:hypothetical protein CLAIMM_01088 [Cladophialophora immunda]